MVQKQFLNVVDRDEAERRFRAAILLEPLGTEQVRLDRALGRVLAADVRATVDVPSFDRSNFDGYAVCSVDTYGANEEQPVRLVLLPETIGTAVVPQHEVKPGTAMAIATGGMMPRGADAVLMIEDSDVEESDRLLVFRSLAAGHGVTFAGTDVSRGEIVVRRGELLTSRETGTLAACGVTEVAVWRRPRVAIVSTGNEIIEPGEPMRPGMVYDSNAQILADAVTEAGGIPHVLGIVRDDLESLRQLLYRGLDEADVVVMSGGTSKGAGDLCYQVVRELNDPGIVAHGVALKPGKPVCLASTNGKPVVVLPGFPTSAVFTFHEFVAPVIRLLGGRPPEKRKSIAARMATKVNSEIGRTEYMLVGLVSNVAEDSVEGPRFTAFPMGKGSGSVTTFGRADGFVTIDRHTEIVPAGAPVSVTLIGNELEPADLVVIGSHCTVLDGVLSDLQSRGVRTKFLAVGSMAGLAAAKRNECDVAGIHLFDETTNRYNRPFLNDTLELIPGYPRRQGFLCRTDDQRFQVDNAEEAIEIALNDAHCMMINRNRGSGTRSLVDKILAGRRPRGYAVQAKNHNAVVAAILQGRADWGIAIEPVAQVEGIRFFPLADEQFDFVVPKSRVDRPAVIRFRQAIESLRAARSS